jgi:hypothetical protein
MIPEHFQDLWSTDHKLQNQAFGHILTLTDQSVTWVYEVWDNLLENLGHKDNHNRAIAAQILCNLAKSDLEHRILSDFETLFAITRDERFVTARHGLQALWKIGVVGKPQQEMLLSALENRFRDCSTEKNCTLIRYDILKMVRKVFDVAGDEGIKVMALRLIESEADLKYRKKYGTLWKSNQPVPQNRSRN